MHKTLPNHGIYAPKTVREIFIGSLEIQNIWYLYLEIFFQLYPAWIS